MVQFVFESAAAWGLRQCGLSSSSLPVLHSLLNSIHMQMLAAWRKKQKQICKQPHLIRMCAFVQVHMGVCVWPVCICGYVGVCVSASLCVCEHVTECARVYAYVRVHPCLYQ